MRYVVYGAGAIGGAIGGLLSAAGRDVVLVARGAHRRAIEARGLTVASPVGRLTVMVPTVEHPSALDTREDDVVLLTVKSQDTEDAVRTLVETRESGAVPVFCAQNGVDNERIALRRFPDVYGMCVLLPATHLEPGLVDVHTAPVYGVLDVGRYPHGVDENCDRVCADLEVAGFSARPDPSVMRSKYRKLLDNMANAVDAACGLGTGGSELAEAARLEAVACLAAAGLEVAAEEEDLDRRRTLYPLRPVDDRRRPGSSSWQSLFRGAEPEVDFLNGEIVLLGRLHGIPTPVNALLQRTVMTMARHHSPPGSISPTELWAALEDTQVAAKRQPVFRGG